MTAAPAAGVPGAEKGFLNNTEDHEPSAVDIEIGGRLANSADGNGDGPVGGRLRYSDGNSTVGGRLGTFS